MEDKTFELLTKMYCEFTEFKNSANEKLSKLHKDVLRMEQDHGNKLQVLFDGYMQHDRKLEAIGQKIDALADKVDRHDIKIQVIEGGRK
ncbi:MAG: hypothetical protein ACM3TR_19855 [Caulobacteraceae bacterium]